MNTILTVYGRGQITLPKKMRDRFATTFFAVEDREDGILIRPVFLEKQAQLRDTKEESGLSWSPPAPVNEVLENLKKANGAL